MNKRILFLFVLLLLSSGFSNYGYAYQSTDCVADDFSTDSGPAGYPIAADFNGDGTVEIGVFSSLGWIVDLNHDGILDPAKETISKFGISDTSAVPVYCDFNGNGVIDFGIFKEGTWIIDRNHNDTVDQSDTVVQFGTKTSIPIFGHFNEPIQCRVGYYDAGYVHLDMDYSWSYNIQKDYGFLFGRPGDKPVVGDFIGSGSPQIGVYRNGSWYLDTVPDSKFDQSSGDLYIARFGTSSGIPVVGDWNGDGIDEIGFREGNLFVLDSNADRKVNIGYCEDSPPAPISPTGYCMTDMDGDAAFTQEEVADCDGGICPFEMTKCVGGDGGGEPTCPEGGTLDPVADVCFADVLSINCDPNYVYEPSMGTCIADPSCAEEGAYYNVFTDRCEKLYSLTGCPEGYEHDPDDPIRCIRPIDCGSGVYNPDYDRCESPPTFDCPPGGYLLLQGKCTMTPPCPGAMVYSDERDRCEETPLGSCPEGQVYDAVTGGCLATVSCTLPAVFNNTTGRCELPDHASCPEGWEADPVSGKCTKPISCLFDGVYDESRGLCVLPPNHIPCVEGYEFDNDSGLCLSDPWCPEGSAFSLERKRCEMVPTLGCEFPYMLDPASGDCFLSASMACPEGTEYNPWTKKCGTEPEQCPPTYTWSTIFNTCIADPHCGFGSFLNTATDLCEIPAILGCGPGFTLSAEKDVCFQKIFCQDGGIYNGILDICTRDAIGASCANPDEYTYSPGYSLCISEPDCSTPGALYVPSRDRCETPLNLSCEDPYFLSGNQCIVPTEMACPEGSFYDPSGNCVQGLRPCSDGYGFNAALDSCTAVANCPNIPVCDHLGNCSTHATLNTTSDLCEGAVAWGCDDGLFMDGINSLCFQSIACPNGGTWDATNNICQKAPIAFECPDGYEVNSDGTQCVKATDCSFVSSWGYVYPYPAEFNTVTGKCEMAPQTGYSCVFNSVNLGITPDPITHKCVQTADKMNCKTATPTIATYSTLYDTCIEPSRFGCWGNYSLGDSGYCEDDSYCQISYATPVDINKCDRPKYGSPFNVPNTYCSARIEGSNDIIFTSKKGSSVPYARTLAYDYYLTFDLSCNIVSLEHRNVDANSAIKICTLSSPLTPGTSIYNDCYLRENGLTTGGVITNTSFTTPGYGCSTVDWFGTYTSRISDYLPPPTSSLPAPFNTYANGVCYNGNIIENALCPIINPLGASYTYDNYVWVGNDIFSSWPPSSRYSTNLVKPALSTTENGCILPEGYSCETRWGYVVDSNNPTICKKEQTFCLGNPYVFDPVADTCTYDAAYTCLSGQTKENMTCTYLPRCEPGSTLDADGNCAVPAVAICDEGYTWNEDLRKCVITGTSYCQTNYDAGFHDTRDRCENPLLPLCPEGSTFNGSQCSSNPICPSSGGSYAGNIDLCDEGSDHLCELGWTFVGLDQDSCQQPFSCPGEGATFDPVSSLCFQEVISSCDSGLILDETNQVCVESAQCPTGGTLDTRIDYCQAPGEDLLCPGMYTYSQEANACVLDPNPCPEPSVWNKTTDRCELPSTLSCPLLGDFVLNSSSMCQKLPDCPDQGGYSGELDLCDAGSDGSCFPGWSLDTENSSCQAEVECPLLGVFQEADDTCRNTPFQQCTNCGVDDLACPENYVVNPETRLCERPAADRCVFPSIFNPDTDRCEQPMLDCPTGSVWSEKERGCLSDPSCDSGTFVRERGRCEQPPEMVCAIPSFTTDPANADMCITPVLCAEGGTYKSSLEECFRAPTGGICEDPSYTYSTVSRLCEERPKCSDPLSTYNFSRNRCEYPLPAKCETGYLFDGVDKCSRSAQSICGTGTYQPDTGTCVRALNLCPAGYTYDPGLNFCVSDRICPVGTTLINGQCQTPVSYSCPAGSLPDGQGGCSATPDCSPGTFDSDLKLCVADSTTGACPTGYTPEGTTLCWKVPACPEGTSFSAENDQCETPPGAAPSCSDPTFKFNPTTMVCEKDPVCPIGEYSDVAGVCMGTLGPGFCEAGWTEYGPAPTKCEIPILCPAGWSFNTSDKLCHKDTPSSTYPAVSNSVPATCTIRYGSDAAVSITKGGSGVIGSDISALPQVYSVKAYVDNSCNVTRIERVNIDLQVLLSWNVSIVPGASATVSNESPAVSYSVSNLTVVDPSSYFCPYGGVLAGAVCEIFPTPVANTCASVGAVAVLSSGICLKDKTPTCVEPGMTFSSSTGVCGMLPDCGDAGFNAQTDKCVLFATPGSGCPPGTTADSESICTSGPDCGGYAYNEITNRCEVGYGLGCDNGFVFDLDHAVCAKSPDLVCPTGTVFDDATTVCYAPVTEVCPALTANIAGTCTGSPYCLGGLPFNEDIGKCDASSSSFGLCPTGYTLDPTLDKCVMSVVCPYSGVLAQEEGQCWLDAKNLNVVCNPGTTEDSSLNLCYSTSYCVGDGSLDEARDYCTKTPLSYVCPASYQYNDAASDCTAPPLPCPEGSTFNATLGRCEESKVPSCSEGTIADPVVDVCWQPLKCTGTYDPRVNMCNTGVDGLCPSEAKLTYSDDGYLCTTPVPCPGTGMLNHNTDFCQVMPEEGCPYVFTLDRGENMCYMGTPCAAGGTFNANDKCELPPNPVCPGNYFLGEDRQECLSAPECEPPSVQNTSTWLCEMPPYSDQCPYPYRFDPVRAACTSTPDCFGSGAYNPTTNQCESPKEISCTDPDYYYNEATGRCERKPLCRDGEYNTVIDQCVTYANLQCPEGYVYVESRARCEKAIECENDLPYMPNLDGCVIDQACYAQSSYNPDIDQCLIETTSVDTKLAHPEYCGDIFNMPKGGTCTKLGDSNMLSCTMESPMVSKDGGKLLGTAKVNLNQLSTTKFIAEWTINYSMPYVEEGNYTYTLTFDGAVGSSRLYSRNITGFANRWDPVDPNGYYAGNVYCDLHTTVPTTDWPGTWSQDQSYLGLSPNKCLVPGVGSGQHGISKSKLFPNKYTGENIVIPGHLLTNCPLTTYDPYHVDILDEVIQQGSCLFRDSWGFCVTYSNLVYRTRVASYLPSFLERSPHMEFYTNDTSSVGTPCYWSFDKYDKESVKTVDMEDIPSCDTLYSINALAYFNDRGYSVADYPTQAPLISSWQDGDYKNHYPEVKFTKIVTVREDVLTELYTGTPSCPISFKIDMQRGTYSGPGNCSGEVGPEGYIENLRLCHDCPAGETDRNLYLNNGSYTFSFEGDTLPGQSVYGTVTPQPDGSWKLDYSLKSPFDFKSNSVIVAANGGFNDQIADPSGAPLGDVRILFDALNRTVYYGNHLDWKFNYFYLSNDDLPVACLNESNQIVAGSTPFCEPGQWRVGNLCMVPAVCDPGRFDYSTDTCYVEVIKECKFGTYDEAIGACVAPAECPNGSLDRRADMCWQQTGAGCPTGQIETEDNMCASGARCLNNGDFLPETDECLLRVDFECDPPLIFYPDQGICAEPVECPEGSVIDNVRGACVTPQAPLCSESGAFLDTDNNKCYLPAQCGPEGSLDGNIDFCVADSIFDCGAMTFDPVLKTCYGDNLCTTTPSSTYNEDRDRCELVRDTTCGSMLLDSDSNVCYEDAVCPSEEGFSPPSISTSLNKCVSPPETTCPPGFVYMGPPTNRCEAIITCPGGSYDPHTNLCAGGAGEVPVCPHGPEYACLPTSASKRVFSSCDPGYVYDSTINVCTKPAVFVGGTIDLPDRYFFYTEGTSPNRVITNLSLGPNLGDESYLEFNVSDNMVTVSGRMWQDGYWSMEASQNRVDVKDKSGTLVGSLTFQVVGDSIAIGGAPISIRGLLDMRPNGPKIDFYEPGGGPIGALLFTKDTLMIPPNTVNETFCSPYTCYNDQLDYEWVSVDYKNDGEIDFETNECLGVVMIFNGTGEKCRTPGPKTNWFDCCEPGDDSTFVFDKHCKEDDAKLAVAIKEGRAHVIGDLCVTELFGGMCLQNAKVACVFGSKMARIIHEQGRLQLKHFLPDGRWGTPKRPNCEGFSPDDFSSLDFGKIDLSEIITDIAGSVQINTQQLQEDASDRIKSFYDK